MFIEISIFLLFLYFLLSTLLNRKFLYESNRHHANYSYTTPNAFYPVKFLLAKFMITLQQRRENREDNLKRNEFTDILLPNAKEQRLESPQELQQFGEMANDAVAFQGSDEYGNHLLIRLARRPNNVAEIWLLLRVINKRNKDTTLYLHPEHPDGIVAGLVDGCWRAKGLVCEVREPMRRWRLSYNGFMRKGVRSNLSNIDDSLVHVQFEFYWTAISDSFNFNSEIHPNLIADALAREQWSSEFFSKLKQSHEDRYEQWGQMTGQVSIEESESVRLVLKGMRDHCFGQRNWNKYARYTANMGYAEDGTFFHIGAVSIPSSTTHLVYGYVGDSDGCLTAISQSSLNLALLGDERKSPEDFTISFQAGDKNYLLRAAVDDDVSVYNGISWESHSHLRFVRFHLNDCRGTGFSEFEYRNEEMPPPEIVRRCQKFIPLPLHSLTDYNSNERQLLVVPLSHRCCLCKELVGGKACQLAQLTALQGQFTVPHAICVTSNAFRLFLQENQLYESIEQLFKEISAFGTDSNSCQEKIAQLKDKTMKCRVPIQIAENVSQQLNRIYCDRNWETMKFAVRSSGIDEDGSVTSFAGQLDTVLNVVGQEDLYTALKKVWSSNFANECLSYRRQNGLPLLTDVAVLIQEMVEPDISGVMFTCDPLTSHPGKIVINAFAGLGEAVVSGSVIPVTINVSRSYSGKIDSIVVNGDCGIEIKKELIEKLAKIGLELERCHASPRDVEWSIKRDQIYLLQSRPVTNFEYTSEFALVHEFDNHVGGKYEYSTTHNVGEVMAGVCTPLGFSVSINAVDKALQNQLKINGLYKTVHRRFFQTFLLHANQIAIKLTQTIYKDALAVKNRDVSELCLLGKTIDDPLLDEFLLHKFRDHPSWKKVVHTGVVLKMMVTAYIQKNNISKKYKDLVFQCSNDQDCSQLLFEIEKLFPCLLETWLLHNAISGYSAFWYHLLVQSLMKHDTKLTVSNYMDIATLYASCADVESADIPAALQTLATNISKAVDPNLFSSMSLEEALKFVSNDANVQVNSSYKSFMRTHGHRCLKEIDLQAKSWSEDPTTLIDTLKSLVGINRSLKQNVHTSVEEAINKLSFQPAFSEKVFLSWAVHRARNAVGYREQTKSLAIKVTQAVRVGYRKLAKQLVMRGKIPDDDLIYFFTHYELQHVVNKTANSACVQRAIRRRKIKSSQEKIVLPEFIVGHPNVEVDKEEFEANLPTDSITVVGTPVSAGKIKGVARVCTTLEDAKNIQPNEILITHSTDIAWSVYFPIISGIVTELGGLLSHGAVVAREYGIPCLVSANHATIIFKTGDIILLDCHNGLATKLSAKD